MISKKKKVLLILEGTYPYNGGGVSTWAHMLCNRVRNVDYTLYSINAEFETTFKYNLSKNVKNVIQVPLWAPQEPFDYVNYGKEYYKIVNRKEITKEKIIKKHFIPVFNTLIYNIYQEDTDIGLIDETIYQMWLFFQKYDYKTTMKSLSVWNAFSKKINEVLLQDTKTNACIYDLTIGLRWIYRFLIPLSIDIPRTEIAHITLSGFPIIPALVARYKYNASIIATEHGVFIRERLLAINSSAYSFFLKKLLIKFSESITKLAYYKADKILSVNQFNMKWEQLYGADKSKIETIYNGIDHNLFKPIEKPEHLKNTPTVVAAARIFELKDIITMIKSCDVVRKEIPNVKYLIYGDKNAVPEYTEKCEKLIKELNLENNFFLAGYHNEPHLIFSEGDISILTSISEGFPYTVLESMSCATPVVATDVGGVTEALDEKSGFVCKPKDHIAIGNKVILLLKNKKIREQMGDYSRQKIIDNFTIDAIIGQYENVYDTVAKETRNKIKLAKENVLNLYINKVKEAS